VESPFPSLEDPTRLPPLAQRYELIEPIARGGVAWVWRAHDRTLDRPVAVKLLRADADPAFAARFTIEAQTAARIRHPGVVAIYDAGVHDGLPFLAMELLDGETLRALLRRVSKLDPSAVRRLGHALASALDAIRRAGLVHGDLKPENVMIGEDGEPTITDLGLARAVWEQGTDHDDGVWGTPGYLAPERRRGEPGDHRSDVYALGALLFEAATGRTPPSDTQPAWASLVDPAIPEELSAVIARATLADPDERYPTAAALAMQLAGDATSSDTDTQMLDGMDRETVMLKPPPAIEPPRSGPKRRRWLLVAFGAALAVVAAFLLGPASQVTVPLVEGQRQAAAEQELRDAGLEPRIELVYDSVVAAGVVVSQDPIDGARIRDGSTVLLNVSLGPRLVRVPAVQGMLPDAAAARLRDAGFTTIDRQRMFHSSIEEGRVVGTEPPTGEFGEADEPIELQVSKGPDLVAVPSVDGDSKADATAELRAAGFTVDLVREESREVDEGTVIRTEPGGGEYAERGSSIQLVVSKGPPLATVPDLRCMSKKQARDALRAAGFEAESEGSGSRVVDQNPGPGDRAPEGSTVTIFMGFGFFC
jgi:serine/threonine-protein kinase